MPTATRLVLALCLALVGCTEASSAPKPRTPESMSGGAPAAKSAAPAADSASAVRAAVEAPDRTEADRALDAGRKPIELLSFFHIAPGQQVAELFAGVGHTAELLARVVGSSGRVYGENPKAPLERYAEAPWSERLRKPVLANVVRVDRELDAPLPPEARGLDAVLFLFSYHDSVWMGTDRAAMNRAIYEALKPGGVYGIADHRAKPGRGVEDAQSLHRIEKEVIVKEVLAAGFKLDAEAGFLANPADPYDWSASPRTAGEKRGTSDRFVLRFVKPLIFTSASPPRRGHC